MALPPLLKSPDIYIVYKKVAFVAGGKYLF